MTVVAPTRVAHDRHEVAGPDAPVDGGSVSTVRPPERSSIQLALMNILEDMASDREHLDSVHGAMLNILEDSRDEKTLVEQGQMALLNILDDLDSEKAKVDHANLELERSNSELEQFAYIASHDLSEPLRAISGPISVLARRYRGQLDAEADQFIEFAVDGCARMKRMIDDLLAYSRVGRIEGRVKAVDANDVLAAAIENLTPLIVECGAQLHGGHLPIVVAEGSQLGEVFQNLIGNALKFVSPGIPPDISIAAEPRDSLWRFTVTDNGVGIEPRHRERIWGMFTRLHTREEYPGTGIGLALVKKIIERHGGEIGVEDTATHQGSTFWFTLPGAEETPT